jgi:hypothetical protein
MKNKIGLLIVLSTIICFAGIGYSQESSFTLPTSDIMSSFTVYNSSSANPFKVNGTGKVGIGQPNPRAHPR